MEKQFTILISERRLSKLFYFSNDASVSNFLDVVINLIYCPSRSQIVMFEFCIVPVVLIFYVDRESMFQLTK